MTQEQRIMVVMRKTLSKVIRDTTPESPAMKRGIGDDTVDDIRYCLALISARERELAEALGISLDERPRYSDEPSTTNVVSIAGLKKKPKRGQ